MKVPAYQVHRMGNNINVAGHGSGVHRAHEGRGQGLRHEHGHHITTPGSKQTHRNTLRGPVSERAGWKETKKTEQLVVKLVLCGFSAAYSICIIPLRPDPPHAPLKSNMKTCVYVQQTLPLPPPMLASRTPEDSQLLDPLYGICATS